MIKIENVPVDLKDAKTEWHDFLAAIKMLKKGESFFIENITSNHRNALANAKFFLDINIKTFREGSGHRVARTE